MGGRVKKMTLAKPVTIFSFEVRRCPATVKINFVVDPSQVDLLSQFNTSLVARRCEHSETIEPFCPLPLLLAGVLF